MTQIYDWFSVGPKKKQFPMSDEISLSVDDTNALRIKLGLKPLDTRVKETLQVADEPSLAKHSNDGDKKLEVDTTEGKRLLDELTSGGGILELFEEVEDSSKVVDKKQRLGNDMESASCSDSSSSSSSDSGSESGESDADSSDS